jgi:hypothetical protein
MQVEYSRFAISRFGDRRTKLASREVCYFRVTNDEETFGFSELAPLESWGHPSVDELIEIANSPYSHHLLDRALELAFADLMARKRGRSLVLGSEQFENHMLVPTLQEEVPSSFKTVKFKMGDRLEFEKDLLNNFFKKYPNLKVRIDFNGHFSFADDFLRWWATFPLKDKVDFIEDPLLNDAEWLRIATLAPEIPLAADQMLGRVDANILVIKPSWGKTDSILKFSDSTKVGLVITNSLGTTLDQAQAIAEAVRIQELKWKILPCGLMGPVSEFKQEGNRVFAPHDALGFGVDLNKKNLDWTLL